MYIYKQSEPNLWTVGFHRPDNKGWESESDHTSPGKAVNRMEVLNGDYNNNYVYIKTEPKLWTVGTFSNGIWEPESDHTSSEEAAREVIRKNSNPIFVPR